MEKRRTKCHITNKTRYSTEQQARDHMLRIRNQERHYTPDGKRCNRRMKKAGQCRIYFCHDCKGFHMTSNPEYRSKKHLTEYKKKRNYKLKDTEPSDEVISNWKADSLPFPELKKEI